MLKCIKIVQCLILIQLMGMKQECWLDSRLINSGHLDQIAIVLLAESWQDRTEVAKLMGAAIVQKDFLIKFCQNNSAQIDEFDKIISVELCRKIIDHIDWPCVHSALECDAPIKRIFCIDAFKAPVTGLNLYSTDNKIMCESISYYYMKTLDVEEQKVVHKTRLDPSNFNHRSLVFFDLDLQEGTLTSNCVGARVMTSPINDFSNGRLLGVNFYSSVLALRNKTTQQIIASVKSPFARLCAVLTKDKKYLVSGHEDGYIRFVKTEDLEEDLCLYSGESPVSVVTISSDMPLIVSGNEGDGMVQLWDRETQEVLYSIKINPPTTITALAQNGNFLAVGDYLGKIRVYDIAAIVSLFRLKQKVQNERKSERPSLGTVISSIVQWYGIKVLNVRIEQ